jgi:hypothetical protein
MSTDRFPSPTIFCSLLVGYFLAASPQLASSAALRVKQPIQLLPSNSNRRLRLPTDP